jgi:hypothetical protein
MGGAAKALFKTYGKSGIAGKLPTVANLAISNVPGPQVPLYLAGAPLEASYPAMNLKEDCGLSVACTSAAGTMAFGLTADWDSVPDIDVLASGIESAIDDLARAASRSSAS